MEVKQIALVFLYVIIPSLANIVKRQAVIQQQPVCTTPDNSFGTCIPIEQCHVIINFLRAKKSLTVHETVALRSYICGASLSQKRMCCPRGEFNLEWIYADCKTPDNEMGKCKPAKSCAPIRDFIKSHANIDKTAMTHLRRYTCKSKTVTSNDPTVCCPFKPIMIISSYTDASRKLVDHSKHENIGLLPSSCGLYLGEDKITNGNDTEIYEFPWAAAIKLKAGAKEEYDCGGSLISDRYILTAAHCIRYEGREMVGVRLGEHNFAKETDCAIGTDGSEYCAPPYQDFDVSLSDATVHPEFDPITLRHDIALIRLREPVEFSFAISPVCLPITISQKRNKMSSYIVIGWGATDRAERSQVLMKTEVPLRDTTRCNIISSFGQLCAGGIDGNDTCRGDSGSPLMISHLEEGTIAYIQHGIVSQGFQICGKENFPTTYTDITAYMGWILDNLKA